jgi:uncharacterized paraquat-inducible protein A
METMGETDSVNAAVIAKLRARAALGVNKYNVSMDRTDLSRREWLEHAQQEALDLSVYLEKLIQEEKTQLEVCTHPYVLVEAKDTHHGRCTRCAARIDLDMDVYG